MSADTFRSRQKRRVLGSRLFAYSCGFLATVIRKDCFSGLKSSNGRAKSGVVVRRSDELIVYRPAAGAGLAVGQRLRLGGKQKMKH